MQVEFAFLADVRAGRFTLVDDLKPDLDRIAELVERYADLPLGTVDASVSPSPSDWTCARSRRSSTETASWPRPAAGSPAGRRTPRTAGG